MSKTSQTFAFAAGLCIVCSMLLTAAYSGLKPYHQRNEKLDKQKNILKSVDLLAGKTADAKTIQQLYKKRIRSVWIDENGEIISEPDQAARAMPIYLNTDGKTIQSYIIPISSRGLWGTIKGYLALENDGATVAGFTVYSHSETPGLGGEIEKNWFQENFEGKKIVNRAGEFVSVGIVKGEVAEIPSPQKRQHYVDGISGATLTGKYLSEGLRDTLKDYEPVSIRFRKNKLNKLSLGQ